MSDHAEYPSPFADGTPSPVDIAGLLNFSHEAVVVYDHAFCILYANAEAQRQMGLPLDGLIGNVLWELFPASVGPYHEPLTRAMRESVPLTFQAYYAPSGAWAEGRCVPVAEWGAQREPVLAVFFRDITHQKQAAEKAQSLQRVSASLVGALTQTEVARVIVAEAMPALDAHLGLIAALSEDGAEFQTLGLVGYPPKLADAWRTFPADSQTPIADAVRLGEPILLETLAARRARYPHLEDIRAAGGPGGLAAIPLLADGRAVGGLVLVFNREAPFDAEGRAFLLTLAGLCAQALGRARLQGLAQREIEERQRAEMSLRESEQRLRLALDGGNLGSWHWDLAMGVVDWPPKTKALFGLPPDAPIPRERLLGLLHPDDQEWVDAAMRRAIAGGPDYDVEYRVIWPDGSLHWIASRGRVYRDERGVAKNIEGVVQNIDARKRAEETLRENEARYRSLIDATAQIVWTNTSEGWMKGSNEAWAAFTGQSEEEYQGYGWAKAVHPDDAQPTVVAWREAVAARRPFLFEHRLRRHDGVFRTFAIRAVPVLADDGAVREWVGVHTDITERRALEAARETLLAQQGAFLRDVLSSVTEGKLFLAGSPAQLPSPLTPVGEPIPLTREGGLWDLRRRVQAAARDAGHSPERVQDLMTAASEAGMNAVTHGGGAGTAWVSAGEDGKVQVRVEDHGAGITMENLPRAALERGFSTKATLGHGLKMILETVDRLYLLTGPAGTTVVIESERADPPNVSGYYSSGGQP